VSKIVALPQMKVGWIAGFGPEADRREAIGRLEIVADTFLSLNAPAQLALPVWLAERKGIQRQILDRVRANAQVLGGGAVELVPVEAGWSGVVRIPQRMGSERLAETLIKEAGVVVHPGSFYGLAGRHTLVVSLLMTSDCFAAGVDKLNKWIEPG
jgi:aspartate/methionine/tyrosine aminotransferase